eukprot:161129-Rhodomonas_salina.1
MMLPGKERFSLPAGMSGTTLRPILLPSPALAPHMSCYPVQLFNNPLTSPPPPDPYLATPTTIPQPTTSKPPGLT